MPRSARSPGAWREQVVAAVGDAPARHRLEAGDALHERRLAGAVRTDQPDDLALVDLEVDVVERREAAEADADLGALEHDLGVRALRPRRGARAAPSGSSPSVRALEAAERKPGVSCRYLSIPASNGTINVAPWARFVEFTKVIGPLTRSS